MRLPLGRLIWVDSGDFMGGRCLWMVIRGPFHCGLCGALNMKWFHDEFGNVICQSCGLGVNEYTFALCPHCGEDDWHSIRLVCNNDFGMSMSGDYVKAYNDNVGRVLSVCGKGFDADFRRRNFLSNSHARHPEYVILSASETIRRKRLLTWTCSDDYVEGGEMPDWVIDSFPDGSQE